MASQHGCSDSLSLLTSENQVQLAKAQLCQALENMFGGDSKLWLRALKRLEAEGSVKAGPYLDALHELMADLEKLIKRKRGSGHE